ncbi:hypothetical protein [Gracilibacillus sp. JCM 18860]|uniref:hypothetical protein n=1 Tax=Gracilibacillus sp. JCM 18860 TaxID=1306159 RepID=UPI0006CF6714
MKSRKLIFAFVFFVLGFLLTFSYQYTKSKNEVTQLSEKDWEQDYYYRQQLIELEDKNKQLRNELANIRQEIQTQEQELANEADVLKDLVDQKLNLQKLVGELSVSGDGG